MKLKRAHGASRRGVLVSVLSSALVAGCASDYQAPVFERGVGRPPAAKPAARVPAEQRPESYTVRPRDTLYSIALDNGLDYRELAAWNGISDPAVISVGQTLRLRGPEGMAQAAAEPGVQVQPMAAPGSVVARPLGAEAPQAARAASDMLKTGPKAVKLPYSEENLAMLTRPTQPQPDANSAAALKPAPLAAAPLGAASVAGDDDQVDWSWPAAGRVLAGFSEATNKGLDIVGKIGDPVYASASGRVVYSGTGLRGYGKLIIIKHNQTYLSAYAHNSNILVKEGQNVTKGQKIAEVGNTDSAQAKLHFEIRRLGKPVDPIKYLPNRPS
jgi:lipoprotein NlpD